MAECMYVLILLVALVFFVGLVVSNEDKYDKGYPDH